MARYSFNLRRPGRGYRFAPGPGRSELGGWAEILQFGFRLGRVFGIEIRLHILLILFLLIEALRTVTHGWFGFLIGGLGFPLVLFGSVLLHELGHCYGAWIVRGQATQIILWPLGGMAFVSGSERSPHHELLVTLLGPAVNLIIAAPVWLLLHFVMPAPDYLAGPTFMLALNELLEITLYINVALFLFNMLVPIFPMDCARIVRALMALRMNPQAATDRICTIGLWVAGFGLFSSLFFGDQLRGTIIPAGPLFMLICVMGILSCLQTRVMLRLGHPIYTSYQSYGGRAFYTATPADWRRVRAWEAVKGLFARFKASGRQRRAQTAGAGTARVYDLGEERAAATHKETERERYFRELRQLEDDLRAAAQQKDFARATRLRDQIAAKKAQKP